MIFVHQQPSFHSFYHPLSTRSFVRPSLYVVRQPNCKRACNEAALKETEKSKEVDHEKQVDTTKETQQLVANETNGRTEPEERVIYSSRNGRVYETNDQYYIAYDLPGVKEEDVKSELDGDVLKLTAERKRSDKVTVKYGEKFVLDRTLVDTDQVTSKLEDGVLTITFAKKEEAKPFSVQIQALDAPAEPSDKKGLFLTIDVPGVKASDAKVEVNKNHLLVQCERKRQHTGQSKILRQYSLNPSVVDLTNVEAFLLDGVLTVIAPSKPSEPVKTIALTSHKENSSTEVATTEATTAATTDDEDKKEYEIVVETADDEE